MCVCIYVITMAFDVERKKRLEFIGQQLDLAVKSGEGTEYKTILEALQINYGLTPAKAREYIDLIISFRGYAVLDGIITKPKRGNK